MPNVLHCESCEALRRELTAAQKERDDWKHSSDTWKSKAGTLLFDQETGLTPLGKRIQELEKERDDAEAFDLDALRVLKLQYADLESELAAERIQLNGAIGREADWKNVAYAQEQRAEQAEARAAELELAAGHVVVFDWSDNDDDAVEAIQALAAALARPAKGGQ